jgi:hypothetical protein
MPLLIILLKITAVLALLLFALLAFALRLSRGEVNETGGADGGTIDLIETWRAGR